jgi:RHH-type proline utilization regulon transcriptional repressor/proline dehydrogenase/delta 1-pyrroline-5-carboxylate dehydrogenase
VGPTLLELPLHQAKKNDSWAQKEIFGPLAHVIEYESLAEAVELFNSSEYALTVGIYSQSQDDIDFLLKFLRAGNIYVNRPNTGARVGIEPFGGFKLSGTGPKAGGGDYLREFHFVLPVEVQKSELSFDWARDSGYELLTPRPSFSSATTSVLKLENFWNAFLLKFEEFLSQQSDKEREDLIFFTSFFKKNLGHHLNGKHLNFVIPGQLSFNDKSLIKDSGLFVMINPFPSARCVHYLISALSLGTGISVACLTQDSFVTWRSILDLAWKSGFSKSNIDCTLISPESVQELMMRSDYSFIYADEFVKFKDVFYHRMFDGEALSQNMRLVLSEVDGVDLSNPTEVLNLFVWARSFAINTMRHGAPLEYNS